jgi:shikimate kinase
LNPSPGDVRPVPTNLAYKNITVFFSSCAVVMSGPRDKCEDRWHLSATAQAESFKRDASIILVGTRGVGKSSLAVLTAMALKWKFIDLIVTLETLYEESFESMREKYPKDVVYKRESDLLASLLERYPTECVIATTSNSVEEPTRGVLMKYRRVMPIIHITREWSDIEAYLKRQVESEDLIRLSHERRQWYRYCSDFEFRNTGILFQPNDTAALGLKNAQREFLRFLRQIYEPVCSIPDPSAYTHSLVLPYADVTHLKLDDIAIGADAVQIRIDLMALWALNNNVDVLAHIATQIGYLRRQNVHIPIIYDMGTTPPDQINRNLYHQLMSFGFRLNVEYVAMERHCFEDAFYQSIIKHNTRVIGVFRPNVWDVSKLDAIIRTAVTELRCDIVCLKSYALEIRDNWQLLDTMRKLIYSGVPFNNLIFFNEGPLGKLSRSLNHMFTPVSHSSFWGDAKSFYNLANGNLAVTEFRDNVEGDMTVREANAIVYSLNLQPRKYLFYFGIGNNYWGPILRSSIDGIGVSYIFCDKSIAEMADIRQILSSHNFGGAFVSEAFKESILAELPNSSTYSKIIGASNIVVTTRDPDTLKINSLTGENTEWEGIYNSILKNLSTRNSITSSTTAMVVGTGGLGRAAVFALISIGVKNIFIYDEEIWRTKRVISQFHGIANEITPFGSEASNVAQASDTVTSMRYIIKMGDLSRPDTQRPKTFGTLSFETDKNNPTIGCIDSLDCQWPKDRPAPAIIINCSHTVDFELDTSWFANPTGGLGIDIGRGSHSRFFKQLQTNNWVNVTDAEVWIEVANCSLQRLTGKRSSLNLLREAVNGLV